MLFEEFDGLGDVLGVVAGAEEDGVAGFDEDEVADADGSDEFFGSPEKIAGGIGGETGTGGGVSLRRIGEKLEDGGPGADVAPADFGWNHKDAGRNRSGDIFFGGNAAVDFSAASGLHDGVVDGDALEFGVDAAKGGGVAGSADGFGKFFELGIGFREVALKVREKSGDAPEKHAGVPKKAAGFDVASGDSGDRFFGEALDGVNGSAGGAVLKGGALDIAVAGFGASGRNAHDHQIPRAASDVESDANEFLVGARIGDVGVGGKNGHDRVAVLPGEMNGGEADGCSGVASGGLGENLVAGNFRKLLADGGDLLIVGDHPKIRGGKDGSEACGRFAKHGLAAGDVQKLFWGAGAGAGPETGAASPSEEDGAGGKRLGAGFYGAAFHGEILTNFEGRVQRSDSREYQRRPF
jgi:hypothetical protein